MMKIIRADMTHLNILAPMFDAYRLFYSQPSNMPAAAKFLHERLSNQDSVIFLAVENNEGMGFTQLYPTLSSISMEKIYILNDLYVKPEHREKKIARQLMRVARDFAVKDNAVEIMLSTATDNLVAQKLYESEGYKKNERFIDYFLSL